MHHSLDVPENFLDPITCEIMTQPIVLPSGKVIDQSTLEKHEENEAIWGRPSSDPFTGIPLSQARRPVAAIALKAQIDKFLLENSDAEEVRQLPRVLGSKFRPKSSLALVSKQCIQTENVPANVRLPIRYCFTSEDNSSKRIKLHCHNLPVASIKRGSNIATNKSCVPKKKSLNVQPKDRKQSDNKLFIEGAKRSFIETQNNCDCCISSIFYKLPCKHVVCRKVLLSSDKQCVVCKITFENSDPERIHS